MYIKINNNNNNIYIYIYYIYIYIYIYIYMLLNIKFKFIIELFSKYITIVFMVKMSYTIIKNIVKYSKHTHVGFPCFMGTFHGCNGFYTIKNIFYRPTPTLHLNLPIQELSAFLDFQKSSFCMIYKLVSSWGLNNVPTRTMISDIAIFVGTFCLTYIN